MNPIQDCSIVDVGCAAGQAVQSAWETMIADFAETAATLVVEASGWWTTTESVNPLDPAVLGAQNQTRDLILIILVGSVLVQAIRMIISRKAEPLMAIATGLLRYAVVTGLALGLLDTALKAGDALSQQLLDNAAMNFAGAMRTILTDADATLLVLIVSVIAALMSLVQWVLMALRQAGLLVLAAMLPLAASGSINRSTRSWLDRMLGWLIALVAYKPAAAFIYYIGFSYLSSPEVAAGGQVATMITGIMVLLLAVVAMPVMLKFFSWSGISLSGASGGGSGFLGATGAVAMSKNQGHASVDRAAALDAQGPGSQAAKGSYSAAPAGAAKTVGTEAVVAGAAAAGVKATGGQMTGGDPK